MIDISFISKIPYIGYIYLGIVGLVTLLTIIINTNHGIIRDLFKIGYYVILYFMFKYLYPYGVNLLSSVAFLSSKPTLLTILTAAAIIIIWLILRKIFHAIFKKLFKKEKKISKFLGFLFSLPVVIVFNVLLVNLLDPFLFVGTQTIANDPLVRIYNDRIMQPIQDGIFNANLPSSLEGYMSIAAFDNKEERKAAYENFKDVKNYMIQGSSYLNNVEDAEFAKSLTVVITISSNLNNEKLKNTLATCTTNYINDSEGKEIHLGDLFTSFQDSIVSVDISAQTLLKAQSIFSK